MGWKKNQPCFKKVTLKANVPEKILNTSVRNIKNKKLKYYRKYISDDLNFDENTSGYYYTDADIVDNAKKMNLHI